MPAAAVAVLKLSADTRYRLREPVFVAARGLAARVVPVIPDRDEHEADRGDCKEVRSYLKAFSVRSRARAGRRKVVLLYCDDGGPDRRLSPGLAIVMAFV